MSSIKAIYYVFCGILMTSHHKTQLILRLRSYFRLEIMVMKLKGLNYVENLNEIISLDSIVILNMLKFS